MVGAIGVLFRMVAGHHMCVLLIATDGAEAILAVGMSFTDKLATIRTGAAMVITIGGYKGLVACECVIVLFVAADGADVILAVGVGFKPGQLIAHSAGCLVTTLFCCVLPYVVVFLITAHRAGTVIAIVVVDLDNDKTTLRADTTMASFVAISRLVAVYIVIVFLIVTDRANSAVLVVGMGNLNLGTAGFASALVDITIQSVIRRVVHNMIMIHVTTDRTGITLHGVPFPDPLAAGGTGTIVIGFAQVHR